MAAKRTIASRSSWGARYDNGVGNRPVGSLEKYFHHTVTSHLDENATVAQERAQMRAIESIGEQRFGRGISYTFIIFPSGRIYQGADVHRISYHSGGGRNTRGVGVCLAGNYEANKITSTVIEAVAWLLQEGVRQNWWNDPALTEPHRAFKATSCPGKYAYAAFDEINKLGRGGTVTAPKPPAPKPTPKPPSGRKWPDVKISERKGYHDTASHEAWVKLLADVGYKDRDLTKNFQRWLDDLGYDVGPDDGKFGSRTTMALQAFLVDKGLLPNRYYIDGDRGPVTIKAERAYLNDQRRYY